MFGKWFASAYTGSMIGSGGTVFAVWSWVIANAGRDGSLEINPVLLAALIGDPQADIEAAIAFLCGPDPRSRSEAENGRRLLHNGAFDYVVVNHKKYRDMRSAEDRREYKARKAREYRSRDRAGVDAAGCCPRVDNVDPSRPIQSTETEYRDRVQTIVASAPREPKRKKRDPAPLLPVAYELAQYLYDAIRSHDPDFESGSDPVRLRRKVEGWARDLDKLVRLDGKKPDAIRSVIDQCHRSSDEFERGNVQSGAKVRKRWNQLWAKTKSARNASGAPGKFDNLTFGLSE